MSRVDPGLLALLERRIAEADPAGPAPIIGISGSQGSGKSTLAATAAEAFGAVALSLDDVYLTRAERQAMAGAVHTLFAVRGPPGTHDLDLLNDRLDRLRLAQPGDLTSIPSFNKLADDRRPEADWRRFKGRPSAILLEGWCLGAQPQTTAALAAPINALERNQDAAGAWRGLINARLAEDYGELFARLNGLLFFRAPSFEQVLDWRCEQEAALRRVSLLSAEQRSAIAIFVGHFERLTRHMLGGGVAADLEVSLDADRRMVATCGRLARF
jgi:D-glycerate 3-kinase